MNPGANGVVRAIALQPDGKVLVGGEFTSIGGQNRRSIARLNADGALDTTFNHTPPLTTGSLVSSIALQSDGRMIIVGQFAPPDYHRGGNDRLNPDGSIDLSFPFYNTHPTFGVMLAPDGNFALGGNFSGIRFLIFGNDTTALQNLSATSSTITWTLDGSSPVPTRVTFEQSTDGVNYTPLGTDTDPLASLPRQSEKSDSPLSKSETETAELAPQATSWSLTGLNLPTGQNLFIRVRGFYPVGFGNSSETFIERVHQVLLLAPTAASVEVSGRVLAGNRGVPRAVVSVTDIRGETRTARTDSFGYYRFTDLEVGQTYIFQVKAKRYSFAPQVIAVNEELTQLNFSADDF